MLQDGMIYCVGAAGWDAFSNDGRGSLQGTLGAAARTSSSCLPGTSWRPTILVTPHGAPTILVTLHSWLCFELALSAHIICVHNPCCLPLVVSLSRACCVPSAVCLLNAHVGYLVGADGSCPHPCSSKGSG